MSDAVLDTFPRRPIALAAKHKDRKGQLLWLLGGLALMLAASYFSYDLWRDSRLRADLNARGVSAEVLDAEGTCTSRRGSSLGCNYTIRYRLRPGEDSDVREGDVYVPGDGPRVFAPPARYDPQNPDRIMSEADLERGKPFMSAAVPIAIPGVLGALSLLVWHAMANRSLVRAAASPRPLLVPVSRVEAVANTNINMVHFRRPDGSEGKQRFNLSGPLTIQSSDGRTMALALLGAKDRPVLLSHDLTELELTADERAAILAAARK